MHFHGGNFIQKNEKKAKAAKFRGMSSSNISTGKQGEDAAARFLQQHGYRILARNWRHKRCEVDIIAEDNISIVIAEVKTLKQGSQDIPENRVDAHKEKMLSDAAEAWLEAHPTEKELRFDIIAVSLDANNQPTIRHFRDAFYPLGEI
jgi:putative endonuclease